MPKYTVGIDYGTLSGRALLVNTATGEELAEAAFDYPHGVMDEALPNGAALPPDWALQYPGDYIDVLRETVPRIISESGVSAEDIIGIGVDFTACTVLPVDENSTPLCYFDKYKNSPHAFVKLWKHHAAQGYANKINEIALSRGEKWISRYGGKISSEWLFPKLWQILEEAPEIYQEMAYFIEAGDWLIWQLTGCHTRNSCAAGYKALWHKEEGYPEEDFFAALDPRLKNVIKDKLNCQISPTGSKAGELTPQMAELTGLLPGTSVSVSVIDAHACVPGVKINGPGKMLAIIGTSGGNLVMDKTEIPVPGICGIVEDGILPGYFGYEAGQSCVGDHFAWFVENLVPPDYFEQAKNENKNIHKYLREKAEKLKIGESGLIALDWWNGNRSVLENADLTGVILGLTLQTKPEEIYRALIEATAFGTRKIISTMRENGLEIREYYAAGGIARKDPMMMQIYADVINMPIYIAGSGQSGALGAAIFGAVAAGSARGGYDSVVEAAPKMGKLRDIIYRPVPENVRAYNELYREYEELHDYFGGVNEVMIRLKEIKKINKGVNQNEIQRYRKRT